LATLCPSLVEGLELMNLKVMTIIFSSLFIFGCVSATNFPVDVKYLGDRINFPVDSDIAKYYLEEYLVGTGNNEAYDKKIKNIYESYPNPTQDQLAAISKLISVDFAALYFSEYVRRTDNNNRYNHEFQSIVEKDELIPSDLSSGLTVLFVPGWDYEDNGNITGSDLKRPMVVLKQIGINTQIAKVPPVGSVEEIAIDVAKYIERLGESDSKIVIVSASSAGAAIYLALADHANKQLMKNIVAWVNLGGIINGSALVDHYLEWPQRSILYLVALFQGWDIDNLESMSRSESRKRVAALGPLEEHIFIVNYIGLGLSGALSDLSTDGYKVMSDYGPNDGLALLGDMIVPNGVTILAPLSDHFYKNDKQIDKKTIALFHLVMKHANRT
jgi:hypothetical protein